MQIFNIINDLIQTGCDRVAVAAGIFAVKGIKNDRFICIAFIIALHHGELIEIREQSKIQCTHKDTPF